MFNAISEVPINLVEKMVQKKVIPANQNKPPRAFLPEGSRNINMARIAGYFRGQHSLDEFQLKTILSTINQLGAEPLPEYEVEGIAQSISKYPANDRVEYDDGPLAGLLAPLIAETSCRTPATGWLRFDGRRWIDDPEGAHAKEQI